MKSSSLPLRGTALFPGIGTTPEEATRGGGRFSILTASVDNDEEACIATPNPLTCGSFGDSPSGIDASDPDT